MPKAARVKGGMPKTVLEKVVAVIKAAATPSGSSRPAIAKALQASFGTANPTALKAALKKGTESGLLVQTGQRWAVAGFEPPPPPPGEALQVEDVTVGGGEAAAAGDECTMSYEGTLAADGSAFDSAARFTFTLGAGEVIKGWDAGVAGMRVGGVRRLVVPPKLGYGKRGSPPEIPPDATLCFRVKLLKIK
eukprot:jgi/Tetstr1/420970/TSEL_012030.t1